MKSATTRPDIGRQSNIELLRIVSMMMVLAVHIDGASLGLPESITSSRDVWRLVVEALAIVGVNCFTMISGYFGIKLSLKNVISFIFQCVFYSVGIYTAFGIAFPSHFSWSGWLESWMVLTHTDLWYVPAYFCLMIISPMLNAGMDALTKRMFTIVLCLFTAVNIWGGWWWGGSFNPTGYTVIQLVWVYMIARYLRVYCMIEPNKRKRTALWALASYAVSVFGIAVCAVNMPTLKAYAYNAPLVITATVALFAFFLCLDIRSHTVNYIAKSAFAVYLLHKAPIVWGNAMKPAVVYLWESLPLAAFTFAAIGLMAGIYVLAMAIDALRRMISDKIFSYRV